MTITSITEVKNNTVPISTVIKERMDKFIPNINVKNIPNRNGFIYALVGSGGSGKTNLLLNFFKSKKMYRTSFQIFFIFVLHHHLHLLINIHFKNMTKFITL